MALVDHAAVAQVELFEKEAAAAPEALLLQAEEMENNNHVQGDAAQPIPIVFAEQTLSVWVRQQYMAHLISLLCIVYTLNVCLNPMIIDSVAKEYELDPNPTDFNSYFYIGAFVGVLFSMILDYNSIRILVIKISVFISVLGWLFLLTSKGYADVLTGRVFMGFATGLHTVYVYYYLYEIILIDENFLRNYALTSTPPGFFGVLVLVVVASSFLPWKLSILIGVVLHLHAINNVPGLPESPYVMIRNGEPREEVRREFAKLVRQCTPFTYVRYRRMESNAAQAILMENVLSVEHVISTLRLVPLFICSELCGISIYFCYVKVISESEGMNGQMLLCIFSIIFYFISRWLSSYFHIYTNSKYLSTFLISSSFLTMLNSLFLATLFSMEAYKIHYFVEIIKIIILQFYFLAYSVGWICVQNVLFNVPQPYYITMRMMAPLLLCKYFTAYYLAANFIPTDFEIGKRSFEFAFASFVGLVYIFFMTNKILLK